MKGSKQATLVSTIERLEAYPTRSKKIDNSLIDMDLLNRGMFLYSIDFR